MQFNDFLKTVWRRRAVVLIVALCSVAAAGLYAESRPSYYESTATVAFTPNTAKSQGYVPQEALITLLSTYAEIVKSESTLRAAAGILGHKPRGSLSTSTGAPSGILQISVTFTNSIVAAESAKAVTEAFVKSISSNPLLVPTIVNPPVPSHTALQPRPPLIISLAAILGLALGLFAAVLWDSARRTADDAVELAEVTGMPVIGRIQRERALARADSNLIWGLPELELTQESFRALRTNVEFLIDKLPSAVQITSAGPGQGKSTIVANLAIAMGQIGVNTIVVDADLRRPRQHEIFGVGNSSGLSTALMFPDREFAIRPTDFENVSVLTSGPHLDNAPEMLHIRFRSTLRSLLTEERLILIDSPPVLPVSDARVLSSSADAVLLVVAADRDRVSAVESAVDRMRFARANLAGIVLNFTDRDRLMTGYGYGYGYGHGRSSGGADAQRQSASAT